MKSLKKLLIASLILIIIGFLGLSGILIAENTANGFNRFGIGPGYGLSREDMLNMMGQTFQSNQALNLSFESVKEKTEDYLRNYDQSNLAITEIMEFSENYYIEVIEKDTGMGAMELLVDKSSGVIFPEYGPDMMWNLKYGMHRRLRLSDNEIEMNIDETKALELAESYLNKISLNETAGNEAEKFYGYYTIHTLAEDGSIAGMLSVNGFTGQVWYHSWHGIFIDMREYNES